MKTTASKTKKANASKKAGSGEISLAGVKVLLVFHTFRRDDGTFAFLTDLKNLGVVPPVNLLCVSAWLKQYGAEVSLLEASALDMSLEDAIAEARKIEFDFLCFTLTNLDWVYGIRWVKAFAKEFSSHPILVGGRAPEAYPEEVAKVPEITTAFHSRAEACAAQYMQAYTEGGEWWKTPGTCSEYEGEVHLNPPAALPDPFIPLVPDRALVPDIGLYYTILSKYQPFTPGLTVIGCPHPCDFCAVRKSSCIIRDPVSVVDEMEVLEKQYGVREMDFFDADFMVSRDRTVRICQLYRERGLTMEWGVRARVASADKIQLDAMKSANCRFIGYGIESASSLVMQKINKDVGGLEHVREVLQMTKDAGISPVGFFMLGLPGESEATLKETQRFIDTAPLDLVQINSYWPIPNTPIYDKIVEETGVDTWKLIITEGPQLDLPLLDTEFTVSQMQDEASRLYRRFYSKPRAMLHVMRNIKSIPQLLRYAGAAKDMAKGLAPLDFGRIN